MAPNWFANKAQKNKELIIAIAKNGYSRPNQKRDKLGNAITNYTRIGSGSYDPEFDKQIRELRPDWFNKKAK